MKKIIFVGIILFSFFTFCSVGQAATDCTVTSLTVSDQGILPKSGPTAVLGINIYNSVATTLTSVTVTFNDESANSDLAKTDFEDLTTSDAITDGLTLYRDDGAGSQGYFASDDNLIACDATGDTWRTYILDPTAAETIPINNTVANKDYDYYIVIRTSDTIEGEGDINHRDKFKVEITSVATLTGGVGSTHEGATSDTITAEAGVVDTTPHRSDWSSVTAGATNTNKLYPGTSSDSDIYRFYFSSPDEGYEPGVWWGSNDEKPQLLAINTPTAVLGLDVAAPKGTQDGSGYVSESLTSVEVTLTNTNANFDPNTQLYWIALYKDDGDGIFSSAADTIISAKKTAWTGTGVPPVSPYTLTLTPTSAEYIAQTVDYKVDYFVVICSAVTDNLGYGGDFKVSIETGVDVVDFAGAAPDIGLCLESTDNRCKPIYANLKLNYATSVAFPSGSTHSYIPTDYWGNSCIDAESSIIPVIGIDICDGYDSVGGSDLSETFDSVKVTFSGANFGKGDLAPLSTVSKDSGVSLWKDNKTAGWVGTFDEANDIFIELDSHSGWTHIGGNTYSVTLYKERCEIYPSDDYTNNAYRGDDYFICIKTSKDISYDDEIKVSINDGDIEFKGRKNCAGSGITVDTFISNLPTILSDETLAGQEIPRDSDATAVLGMNLVRPAATNVYLSSLVVQFLNKGGDTDFTISDLVDLSKDAGISGIAIYKDNKADADNRGKFDSQDTEVDLIAKPCQFGPEDEDYYRVQMVLATPELIPDSDTAPNDKDDYFVVIRTSKHLGDGDDFSVRLHGSGVHFRSQALGFAKDNDTDIGGTVTAGGVGTTTLTDVGAAWGGHAGELLVLTEEDAKGEGKCFYINSNNATTVTCNAANFSNLEVKVGDTFKFLPILRTTYKKLETHTLTGYLPVNVISPSIEKDPARNNTYTITWTNKDLPAGSTVSIYYDLDNDDSAGTTLIAAGLSSTPGTQTYTWTFNAGTIPDGYYYIYIKAVEADGVTRVTSDYSSGTVWTKDDNPPTKAEVSEPSSNIIFDGCTDTFVDGDGTVSAGSGTQETLSIGALLTSFKTADLVYWYDADSSNTWSDGDALWLDKNYDGRYDSGDSLIIGSPAVNTGGTILTDDYHFVYYDKDKDAGYDSGEDIYYEAGEGNHYYWYSGSPSSYEATIRYDVADSDSVASLTLYADDDTNPDNGFALTIANLTEEDGEGSYSWDVSGLSGVSYYVCAEVDDGFNYPLYGYSTGKVGVNNYPYIKVSSPSVDTWTYSSTYTISWTDADPDDNALISLYYDEDAIPDNGNETLITTTTENSATDSYEWSLSSVANGTYYLAAKIDDEANDPYYSYSEGKLTIMDTPEVILAASESYDAVTLNWTDSTPEIDDKTVEIYRRDKKNGEWSEYAKIATPSSSDTSYEDTSLELGVIGGYFVQITSASLGTLYLSNSSTSTINPLEAQRLAFPDEETPDGLEVIPGVNVITVQWNDNSEDEDSYEVERKLESAGTDKYANITTTSANSTNYDDTGVTADVGYSYRARARKYYPETGNYGYSKYTGEAAETSYTFDDNLTVGGATGGGGGCFIATAAFGTEMAEEVTFLKKFRDDVLMKTGTGKSLIKLYYSASPPIANFIKNEPMLKALVRIGLKPLVWWSKNMCCHSRD